MELTELIEIKKQLQDNKVWTEKHACTINGIQIPGQESMEWKTEGNTSTLVKGGASFRERFDAIWKVEKPLREWVIAEFVKACLEKGMTTKHDIWQFVYNNDRNCTVVEVKDSCKLVDDETWCVQAVLDYDCDTTLAKIYVMHKPSGLRHSNAIDLGEKYLHHGLAIVIS